MTDAVAVVGGGPAGLMAAEVIAGAGVPVTVFEATRSPGRKFLLAGRGGLNLTHSEPRDRFLERYGSRRPRLQPAIDAFGPDALRAWCADLGEEPFVGSSGRVFPASFRATPLLRAWLRRLDALGVAIVTQARWTGWAGPSLTFADGRTCTPPATVLALGGASWPRTGSDGAWVPALTAAGVAVTPLAPANAGLLVDWTPVLAARAGEVLKDVVVGHGAARARGDVVITARGLEGGPVYALTRSVRSAGGPTVVEVDLRPDVNGEDLTARLQRGRTKDSASAALRRAWRLSPTAIAVLREPGPLPDTSVAVAARAKAVPLVVRGVADLGRAISTAGGVTFDAVDDHGMLLGRPGTFIAGEMLDWEAPTGGYLLQACFSTGAAAGRGVVAYLGGAMPDR